MNDEIRSISRPRQRRAELGITSVFDHLVEFEGIMLLLLIHHVSSCIIIFLAGSLLRLLVLMFHATIILLGSVACLVYCPILSQVTKGSQDTTLTTKCRLVL